MKHFLLATLSFIVLLSASAQDKTNSDVELNSFYKSRFDQHRGKSVDSAFFYIKKLTSNQKGLSVVSNIVHVGIAGDFFGLVTVHENELEAHSLLLNKASSTVDKRLTSITSPLFLCIQVKKYINDDSKLIYLVNKFIDTQLGTNSLYENRIATYALIIYDIISQKKALKTSSDKLLRVLASKLKNNLLKKNMDTATSSDLLIKEAWYRWMYACTNYFIANRELRQSKIKEAGAYFKIANKYGPDQWSKINSVYYYRDMIFIFKQERSFNNEYINYLEKYNANKEDAFRILSAESLVDPSMKPALKAYYNANFSDRVSFDMYWLENVNKVAISAPGIDLPTINGLQFSLSEQKGKWVLLDFWGTWCGPCRMEHPDLQKFYEKTITTHPEKISLLTIACRDNKDTVTKYMQQFRYSFPVVMADNVIQKKYQVGGYPSKFLITPQGRYIPISLDVNWVEFVENYVGL